MLVIVPTKHPINARNTSPRHVRRSQYRLATKHSSNIAIGENGFLPQQKAQVLTVSPVSALPAMLAETTLYVAPLPRKELRRTRDTPLLHVAATPYGGQGWGEGAAAGAAPLSQHRPPDAGSLMRDRRQIPAALPI